MTNPLIRCAAVALCLLGVQSCTDEWVTLTATDPLDRIVLSPGGEAFVHARPGVELDVLVSTEPFRAMGLRPGMTVEQVSQTLGAPDYVENDRGGRDEVFGFRTEAGDVEVVRQYVSSEGSEVSRWFLRYRPHDCAPLLDPRLVAQVARLDSFPSEVTVLAGADHEDVATVSFDEDEVCTMIWWLQ